MLPVSDIAAYYTGQTPSGVTSFKYTPAALIPLWQADLIVFMHTKIVNGPGSGTERIESMQCEINGT